MYSGGCSVVGTDKILRSGDIYTLTGNISGGIQVRRSNIVIDGASFTIYGDGKGRGLDLSNGSGEDPLRTACKNVTVKNLRIVNFSHGIDNANCKNNTFYGNYIEGCEVGIWIIGSSGNIILYNTFKNNINGISICYSGGNNVIIKNNMIKSGALIVWLSPQPLVDMNYWSEYNGNDNNGDGIGDTPYLYINTDYAKYMDPHPLMNPVEISRVSISQILEVLCAIRFDTISPKVLIVSPQNKTYTVNNVSLTFVVSEPVLWMGYSFDGQANVTISGNTTLIGLPYGIHTIIVYAMDAAGHTGSSEKIHFTIEVPKGNQQMKPDWTAAVLSTAIAAFISVVAVGVIIHRKKKSTALSHKN
jgi:parallel beta-helix repeat protein